MTQEERIAELEAELRDRDDKIRLLTEERDEARQLLVDMRQRIEDNSNLIDNWIEVFQLEQNEAGVYIFNPNQSDLWQEHVDLLEKHRLLVKQWNSFVSRYNSTIVPQDIGRPLAASEAQKAQVLKLRKKSTSLRAIASETSLSLRTVRTIVEKADGKDRAAKKRKELAKIEFNRLRASAFRARNAKRETMPKAVAEAVKGNAALLKAAKGLGR